MRILSQDQIRIVQWNQEPEKQKRFIEGIMSESASPVLRQE